MHTSYEMINGYRTDSNGMIVECTGGMVLVDTCWNDRQTQILLQKIKQSFATEVVLAIITHAHVDRIGGIRTLLSSRIKVVSTQMTAEAAVAAGYPAPSAELGTEATTLRIGDTEIEAYYPGEGHTKDNIVVWVPHDRALFGGCLIKALQSPNLGNIADANVVQWGPSVRKVRLRYPQAVVVIPGHGAIGGPDLLQHTIDLASAGE
jgi:metallo-beta-lactamase class B